MPWWSWLIIWSVLTLALLGMLALTGYRLFRKAVAIAHDLGDLASLTDRLDQFGAKSGQTSGERFHPAVLGDARELAHQRRASVAERAIARQARRDSRVQRGKLLTSADPDRFSHLLTQRI